MLRGSPAAAALLAARVGREGHVHARLAEGRAHAAAQNHGRKGKPSPTAGAVEAGGETAVNCDPQDEFRQWFRARAHVILAPGKTPFEIADPQPVARPPDKRGSIQELRGKSGERQPVQVPQ